MGIAMDRFRRQIEQAGLKLDDTLGYFYAVRVGKYAVYLSKRETCGRIDLSGFSIRHPAVKELPEDVLAKRKLGRVKAQLDFSRPDQAVLEAFRTALEFMKLRAKADEAEAMHPAEGAKHAEHVPDGQILKHARELAHVAVVGPGERPSSSEPKKKGPAKKGSTSARA